jgi:UPF0755 protein
VRKILRKITRLLRVLIVLTLLAGISGWLYLQHWLTTPLALPQAGYHYQLHSGRVLGHLAHDLSQQGFLQHPRLLTLYARFSNATKVHAGEYYFPHGITPQQLLEKLRKGDVVLYQVTLVEGWTFRQALTLLHSKGTIKPLLQGKTEAEQLALLALPISHPEGWFFPDTYVYPRDMTDVEILRRAYTQMQQQLQELWDSRAENLPYKDAYEALIMASIVERETGAEWERDQIAGVFVRRLQKGMRLQTDPTVIYGMGEAYKGKITRKNLQQATPYNTYVIKGLPPTPISLPGRAALQASLNPAEGDALYFVAKGDGTTHFSATLAEHNRAVRRYQLNRRSDYRSTLTPGQSVEQSVNP